MQNPKVRAMESLRKVPLFADLTERELELLAARAYPRGYQPGEIIFSEGDPCEGLYVVAAGSVKIFNTSASGREQVLHIERAGHSLAELPVFDGGPYPASTAAIDRCTLLFISKKEFRALCLERPEVSLKVLKSVSARLRTLVAMIEELSFTTVRQRLISWLLQEARNTGQATPQGTEFTLRIKLILKVNSVPCVLLGRCSWPPGGARNEALPRGSDHGHPRCAGKDFKLFRNLRPLQAEHPIPSC